MTKPLGMEVSELTKSFGNKARAAVNRVSFQVDAGASLGLVGESGSGKTTIARILAGLHRCDAGTVHLLDSAGRRTYEITRAPIGSGRRRLVQLVAQHPHDALNPRRTIGAAIREVCAVDTRGGDDASTPLMRAREMLDLVSLPSRVMDAYPHELSGGQRQRAALARALAAGPKILVADEVTSSLDVSVQAGVLNLLRDLQAELQLTLILVSHDMGVIHYLTERVAVLLNGQIVESGQTNQILHGPTHPFTQQLIEARTLESLE